MRNETNRTASKGPVIVAASYRDHQNNQPSFTHLLGKQISIHAKIATATRFFLVIFGQDVAKTLTRR